MLVRIHDGTRFDTGTQRLLGYVARQSASAGHIVEEVTGIVQSGYNTDLIGGSSSVPSAQNQQDLGNGSDPEKEIDNGIRGLESEELVKEVSSV